MSSFTKASLSQTWAKVRAGFTHAFSTKLDTEVFTLEDLALLERIADTVVKRRWRLLPRCFSSPSVP
jgi:hypothetical protein